VGHDACYKPYAIFDGQKWLLWYNGRHGGLEQIGLVLHPGEDWASEEDPPRRTVRSLKLRPEQDAASQILLQARLLAYCCLTGNPFSQRTSSKVGERH